MRVLFLMPRVSWPPQTGLMLRNYYLAREMARAGARVTCLSFAEDDLPATNDEQHKDGEMLPPSPDKWCEEVVTVKRPSAYTIGKLVRGIVGRTPLPALNYTTTAMSAALCGVLAARPFNVVQVETSTLTEYLPVIKAAGHTPLAVCDWHNIDSELMRRYSEKTSHLGRRFYASRTARRMIGFEQRVMKSYDGHVAVSERDAQQLRRIAPHANILVVENGVDVNYFSDQKILDAYLRWGGQQDARAAKRHRLVFVGSMDYHANTDAVIDFVSQLWPQLRQSRPDLIFTIVGRNPTPAVRRLASEPGVEVTGTVPDVRPFYHEALAQVVPLRVGGGSRLKILEAMAAGVPVISTTLGAEGLAVSDNVNIKLADDGEEIGKAIEIITDNDEYRKKIISAARDLVTRRYDWSALGLTLYRGHEELLRRASANQVAWTGG